MKTRVNVTVDMESKGIAIGYIEPDTEEWEPITLDNYKEVSLTLDCSEEIVYTLLSFSDYLKSCVTKDFSDIWQRLDLLEEMIKAQQQ